MFNWLPPFIESNDPPPLKKPWSTTQKVLWAIASMVVLLVSAFVAVVGHYAVSIAFVAALTETPMHARSWWKLHVLPTTHFYLIPTAAMIGMWLLYKRKVILFVILLAVSSAGYIVACNISDRAFQQLYNTYEKPAATRY